jgi:hypothetical protein
MNCRKNELAISVGTSKLDDLKIVNKRFCILRLSNKQLQENYVEVQ